MATTINNINNMRLLIHILLIKRVFTNLFLKIVGFNTGFPGEVTGYAGSDEYNNERDNGEGCHR